MHERQNITCMEESSFSTFLFLIIKGNFCSSKLSCTVHFQTQPYGLDYIRFWIYISVMKRGTFLRKHLWTSHYSKVHISSKCFFFGQSLCQLTYKHQFFLKDDMFNNKVALLDMRTSSQRIDDTQSAPIHYLNTLECMVNPIIIP